MKKILFLLAHPNLQDSRANRIITQRVRSLPNLTVRPLYDLYPEFFIDVAAEQKLLNEHDIVVLQHPFYWYSMPPLLKLWLDVVLEYGYAYGPGADALKGKKLLLSVTLGGAKEYYRHGAQNGFPVEAFFPMYQQTAQLCGLEWLEPSVLFAALSGGDDSIEAHAETLRERLVALSNPLFSPEERN